ncbi:bifunctional riboflavin kinase/FAD synthetase [candidate division KSB1 bacterium]|nr:bifunctional riboflavin kinase/FAD synthetase [candidate division KSB1 bacterium]
MEIYRDLSVIEHNPNAVITVGMFDGVHRGHQALIEKVQKKASQINGLSTIITFSPHPQLILYPEQTRNIWLVTSDEEKIAIMENLGIDRLIILKFTNTFAQLSARAFIEKILVEKIGFKVIVIGHDHHFGKSRTGDVELLRQLSIQYDFQIELADVIRIDEEIVSSTCLRQLIRAGNVSRVKQFLGRNYTFKGEVVSGEKRGRVMNFPTANLVPINPQKLIPKDGIYAVTVKVGSEKYLGALNTGIRPTFPGASRSIEVNLLNFSGDLYGRILEVEFLAFIREELKFQDMAQLVAQMQKDVNYVRQNFAQVINN